MCPVPSYSTLQNRVRTQSAWVVPESAGTSPRIIGEYAGGVTGGSICIHGDGGPDIDGPDAGVDGFEESTEKFVTHGL